MDNALTFKTTAQIIRARDIYSTSIDPDGRYEVWATYGKFSAVKEIPCHFLVVAAGDFLLDGETEFKVKSGLIKEITEKAGDIDKNEIEYSLKYMTNCSFVDKETNQLVENWQEVFEQPIFE